MNNFIDLTQLSKEDREKYIKQQEESLKPKVRVEPVLFDSERAYKGPEAVDKIVDAVVTPDDSSFVPTYSSEDADAADLKANIEPDGAGRKQIKLTSRTMAVVDCGFNMQLPRGWVTNVSACAEWAAKGLIVTSPLQADAEGRVKVFVANVGKEILVINHGDRIAKIKPVPVYKFRWKGNAVDNDLEKAE